MQEATTEHISAAANHVKQSAGLRVHGRHTARAGANRAGRPRAPRSHGFRESHGAFRVRRRHKTPFPPKGHHNYQLEPPNHTL